MIKLIVLACLAVLLIAGGSAAAAQPKVQPRIGFIVSTSAAGRSSPLFEAFRQGLHDLGYVEGQNISIELRHAEGRLDRMPGLVNELVEQKVDVIVAGNNVVIRSAKEATKTIPIVIITSVDPVVAGYVKSFVHPGGNITGLANLGRDLSPKRVEFLKEMFPKLSRVAVLWDADGPGPAVAVKEYEAAAQAFKIDIKSLGVRGPKPDFEKAFQNAKSLRADVVIVVGNPLMVQNAKQIFEQAVRQQLPTMTEEHRYVEAGALVSYGANLADLYRRAAGYVVDILKGAKPGDLPVKLAEKFQLAVNLKTARRLDINVPQRFLIQADEVIK